MKDLHKIKKLILIALSVGLAYYLFMTLKDYFDPICSRFNNPPNLHYSSINHNCKAIKLPSYLIEHLGYFFLPFMFSFGVAVIVDRKQNSSPKRIVLYLLAIVVSVFVSLFAAVYTSSPVADLLGLDNYLFPLVEIATIIALFTGIYSVILIFLIHKVYLHKLK